MAEKDIHIFLAALTHEAEWIDVNVQIKACRDPKDDKFFVNSQVALFDKMN